eukprot:2870542-Pyramimonas_sp.AAC.2
MRRLNKGLTVNYTLYGVSLRALVVTGRGVWGTRCLVRGCQGPLSRAMAADAVCCFNIIAGRRKLVELADLFKQTFASVRDALSLRSLTYPTSKV